MSEFQQALLGLGTVIIAWATREVIGLRQRSAPPKGDLRASGEYIPPALPATKAELERVEKMAAAALEGLSEHERTCAERWTDVAKTNGRVEARLEELLRRTE